MALGMSTTMLPGGALTARSGTRRMKGGTVGSKNSEFLRFVERNEDAFTSAEDTAVEDVRRILADVRAQYDHVHADAERREAELSRLREAIRIADQAGHVGQTETSKKEDLQTSLGKQQEEAQESIKAAQTARKVYTHMLGRIQKEQVLMKEKLLIMEKHLSRKSHETHRKTSTQERLSRKSAQTAQDLDILESDIEHERLVRDEAKQNMRSALDGRMEAKERRSRFDEWRREVALDAANEAFNASAGRLRKLYAVEKLAGNYLQKITFEQVEHSQTVEDGFQKIREVTGLTDVMDIVHKFLNREVEQEQLKTSVKDAEARLETLRDQYERFKRDADGVSFSPDPARARMMFFDVEEYEAKFAIVQKEFEASRARLQQSTLQMEHMKRWANRMSKSLAGFEECVRVDRPAELPVFFQQMQKAIGNFIDHIAQLISSGKVQKKNMSQVASKEYHEARRLLADKDFQKVNCRVPPHLDAGRPTLGQAGGEEDDLMAQHLADRENSKREAMDRHAEAQRRAEAQKKRAGAK